MVKLKYKRKFSHGHHVLLHSTKKYLKKSCIFF